MARVSLTQAVCVVPSGTYWIGSDSIPNAGPRHVRRFTEDVWIEHELVSWRDYSVFVASGGYADAAWWRMDDGAPFPEAARPASVDARCEAVRAVSLGAGRGPRPKPRSALPVLGLNWFEAAAICRFFGARLPFETEWEVAMTQNLLTKGASPATPTLQEWCQDAYARQYWRADADIRGRSWRAEAQVVVRGYTAMEPAIGPKARRAADPLASVADRGFRRVWDQPPGA